MGADRTADLGDQTEGAAWKTVLVDQGRTSRLFPAAR
jgi:hypothetical protein